MGIDELAKTYSATIDTLWVLLGVALVFLMQAGFAMVETGFTRAKNAGNIIMKSLVNFSLCAMVFWGIGYGIMYGNANGIFGGIDFFTVGKYSTKTLSLGTHLLFSTVFCATAATIVSGALAERAKFSSYLVYSFLISGLIYPVVGHWIWGGGWLSTLSIGNYTGFRDTAGATVVHLLGGTSACIGAKVLGPRLGKYSKETGKSKAIPGHSITLGALGVFLLWFGWFGFNTSSSFGLSGMGFVGNISNIIMVTNISAACATLTTMTITWYRYGKPDVFMTLNGVLAGLVSSTAVCQYVDPWAAAIIGAVAGVIVVFAIEGIDKYGKIDDLVGAIGVHGVCGLWGTLAVGLFARDSAVFTTGEWGSFAIQGIGALAVMAFVSVGMFIVFKVMEVTIGFRVSMEPEIVGLDIAEHGLANAYADFVPTIPAVSALEHSGITGATSIQDAIPVEILSNQYRSGEPRLTKIEIICKQNKFEELKEILNSIGVMGITVTQVLGCGVQKGSAEYYRGIPVDFNLLPKIQVEVVVSQIPVRTVIEAVKKTLYTGHIGDGKIFVYHVENVIKVRTGEEGYDALQDK